MAAWTLELYALGSRPGLTSLLLCSLRQVTCPFWASPFIFTVSLFHLAVPQALQFFWPLGVSYRSEASSLLFKAKKWF